MLGGIVAEWSKAGDSSVHFHIFMWLPLLSEGAGSNPVDARFFSFAAASAALILVIGPDFYTIMNANVNHERYTQSIAMIHSQYQLNAMN